MLMGEVGLNFSDGGTYGWHNLLRIRRSSRKSLRKWAVLRNSIHCGLDTDKMSYAPLILIILVSAI